MIANRRANLMGSDRGDRLGRALRRDRADRQDLGCRIDNGSERGQYLGMDARILDVRHFAVSSRRTGVGSRELLRCIGQKHAKRGDRAGTKLTKAGPMNP
jgi:hypothetical protein